MPRRFRATRRPSPRRLLAVVSAAAFLATAGTAKAQDFCASIDALIDHARSGFAAIAVESTGGAGEQAASLALAGASTCRVTRQGKGRRYHCAWAFPLRARGAANTFEAFAGQLDACLAGRATLHGDSGVNHPDSYAARRYELERAEVSLSLKDKAALGKTFVFIRVRGRNGG